jgi:menaquinone-dependent protoporphyrinogen oxidase
MASLLIVHGTMNGQTALIAGRMAEVARAAGHAVTLVDAQAPPRDLAPADHDAIMVGAWVRGGRHPRAVHDFVVAHRATLAARPTAFFSVSLFAASRGEADQRRARAALQAFLDETGWRPTHAATIAGALRYTRWGWLGRRLMRMIWTTVAERRGWSVDPPPTDVTRDYEYTDWRAVERLVTDLLADLAPLSAPAPTPTVAAADPR